MALENLDEEEGGGRLATSRDLKNFLLLGVPGTHLGRGWYVVRAHFPTIPWEFEAEAISRSLLQLKLQIWKFDFFSVSLSLTLVVVDKCQTGYLNPNQDQSGMKML